MSTVVDEGRLRFTFGDGWIVEKYDGHREYRNGIGKLPGSKAVDVVASNPGQGLLLIEVKDFRDHRIENKLRVGEDLATELGQKVRDSVAGMVGALRNSSEPGQWQPHVGHLVDRNRDVRVLLWLEEDRPYPSAVEERNHKARQASLVKEIKKACRWLTPRAFVVSRASYGGLIQGFAVASLPTQP